MAIRHLIDKDLGEWSYTLVRNWVAVRHRVAEFEVGGGQWCKS